MEHGVIGKITAYIALPISMLSGLALFRMLFFRSSAFVLPEHNEKGPNHDTCLQCRDCAYLA